MPFIHDTKILLEEYNLWNVDRTFYEHWEQDHMHRVYMFACHNGHTNCMVKVNYPEFVEENTP